YSESVLTMEAVDTLDAQLSESLTISLAMLISEDIEQREKLHAHLLDQTAPAVETTIARLNQTLLPEDKDSREDLRQMSARWRRFYRIAASDLLLHANASNRAALATDVRE